MQTVSILGSSYNIIRRDFGDEPLFKKKGIDGWCDYHKKEIVYCNMRTHPNMEDDDDAYCRSCECYTLRHEITHAFLSEAGLAENSGVTTEGWAVNEEMVDWFAMQSPKIFKTFYSLGLIGTDTFYSLGTMRNKAMHIDAYEPYDGCMYDVDPRGKVNN